MDMDIAFFVFIFIGLLATLAIDVLSKNDRSEK